MTFYRLDEILQGGLHCGKITEICGLPDSGKTQLALSISSNVSSDLKQNILYIDSKCDFGAARMHEILKSKSSEENVSAFYNTFIPSRSLCPRPSGPELKGPGPLVTYRVKPPPSFGNLPENKSVF